MVNPMFCHVKDIPIIGTTLVQTRRWEYFVRVPSNSAAQRHREEAAIRAKDRYRAWLQKNKMIEVRMAEEFDPVACVYTLRALIEKATI
jgi:hypothetical protein